MSNAPSMPGRMPNECPSAMHATNATQLTRRFQDSVENPLVLNSPAPAFWEVVEYVETSADHAFSAFLASITPSKALRDRELTFSRTELKRQRFLRQKARLEAVQRQNRKDAA